MDTIGFVGGGNMAEALIKGIITANLYKCENIFVSDIRPERLEYLAKEYGIKRVKENSKLAAKTKTIVLCVKPQHMNEALQSIKAAIEPDALVISVAAGVKTANIADTLGDVAIVRVMPNTPALIGEGASALFAGGKAKTKLKKAKSIFSAVGEAVIVDDEQLIDAVTAVSGSGPAYYFLLTEELIKAAVQLGLPEDMAKKLALQTAKGAALLTIWADKKGQTIAELRKNVTSPGGTTEAALKVFEKGGFGKMVQAAVKTARDRARELSG
jgi:pyrroline-5-carboxylate reductase